MENIPDCIYFKDGESRFIRVNAAMARLFNIASPDEAVGKSDFHFFAEADAQQMFEDEQRVIATGEAISGKVEKKALPDGSVGWTLTTKRPRRGPDGEVIGTCGTLRDITALMLAKTALEQEQNRLKGANLHLARNQALLERKLAELEKTHAEMKAAHWRLIEAEKAQSIDRLALGVACEVRGPLAILGMGVDFFASRLGDEPGALVLKEMRDAVRRADSFVGELMMLLPFTELHFVPAPVSAVVDSAVRPFEAEFAERKIRVVKQYASGLPDASVDVEKMQRVLSSLLNSAADAMPHGGTLSIRVGLTHLVGNAELDDTGDGISPDKPPCVFNPFFPTKPTGRGTGLGLTVSRKVVELHGGTLDVGQYGEGGVFAKVLLKL